ncbi:MAG: sigma-70 family RNA polymerase sigma factor [Bacteroidales bacterium]|nr:sigma-70 family RNA polymerase sigma factor [Bacteroidales bacterium]
MDQDDILIELCKAGDQKAQVEIYRKYFRQVYNSCLRIVNNTADAEDLMQNSFIDAFNKIKHYRGPSSFGGWLKRIAVNNSIDFLAKRKPQSDDLEAALEISDTGSLTDESVIEYTVELVKKAITMINDDYRIILSLSLFEGYDHEEIGQILRLSQANVRTRYSRARQSLIQCYNQLQHKKTTMTEINGWDKR